MLSDNAGERVFSPRTLPALEPLGTPFLEDNGETKKKKKKKKKTPRSSGQYSAEQTRQSRDKTTDDDDDVVVATPRSQPVLTDQSVGERSSRTTSSIHVSTHDDFPSREMLAAGISRVLKPLDGGDIGGGDADTPRARKVKKKKLRQLGAHQNGQARMVGAEGKVETTPRPLPHLMSLDGGGE